MSLKIGLIWDACPSHKAEMVQHRLEDLKTQGRLHTALIPGGLTSVLQLGDLVLNSPCKRFLRKEFLSWQFSEIARRKELERGVGS